MKKKQAKQLRIWKYNFKYWEIVSMAIIRLSIKITFQIIPIFPDVYLLHMWWMEKKRLVSMYIVHSKAFKLCCQ